MINHHYLLCGNSSSFLENFLPLFNTQTSGNGNTPNLYNFDENLVVIYNRVPKTASTSFVNLTYGLCKKNQFHVLHINITGNNHVLSLPNQVNFVRNITGWTAMKPAFYHGHMAFLDFSKWVNWFEWLEWVFWKYKLLCLFVCIFLGWNSKIQKN